MQPETVRKVRKRKEWRISKPAAAIEKKRKVIGRGQGRRFGAAHYTLLLTYVPIGKMLNPEHKIAPIKAATPTQSLSLAA